MAKIKTKNKKEFTVKKLDRAKIVEKNLKNNIVNVKDKTKESYEKENNSAQEYAENKVNNTTKDLIYYIPRIEKKGKHHFDKTVENIRKGKNQIKKAQKEIKNIKQKGKTIIKKTKRNIKRVQNTIKTAKRTVKTAEKTARTTIKTTKQAVKTSVKVAQRTAQMAKVAVKTTIKAIQLAIKATIAIVKAIIAATQALISAIIAGGWIAIIIIIVICLIAMICNSIFGIFFANESEVGDTTMSSVIRELNMEFTSKITEIQNSNEHEEYEINSNRAKWKDIISLYTVVISNGEEQTNVATLDENKINKLEEIFWQMNIINSRVDEVEKDIEITDDNGNIKTEKKKIKILYIDITNKTLEEMKQIYNLNSKQIEQLAELQKEEYNSMWAYVLYGSSAGSNDIVQVAISQIGNVGGQPYWSWYGFKNRVEWCACFVSFCANECGYIDNGIIPKFSICDSEGVEWFKSCELWQDRNYTAKAGDIIFFDWADSNDGKADHVGIVEKVENGKVYTIEGNTKGDMCKQNIYDVNSGVILGYGTPAYR